MNTLSGPITAEGALVEVLLGLAAPDVQALRQTGRPVPAPVAIRAMLDVGAEITCVDGQVLAPLVASGLTRVRVVLVNAPATGGMSAASEYAASLTVVHPSGNPRAGSECPLFCPFLPRTTYSRKSSPALWSRIAAPTRSIAMSRILPAASVTEKSTWARTITRKYNSSSMVNR